MHTYLLLLKYAVMHIFINLLETDYNIASLVFNEPLSSMPTYTLICNECDDIITHVVWP